MVKLRRNHKPSGKSSIIKILVYLLVALALIAGLIIMVGEMQKM
jgi:hypothetical protein